MITLTISITIYVMENVGGTRSNTASTCQLAGALEEREKWITFVLRCVLSMLLLLLLGDHDRYYLKTLGKHTIQSLSPIYIKFG